MLSYSCFMVRDNAAALHTGTTMTLTPTITRTYVRRYSDNGQITAYVEWSNGSRTESSLAVRESCRHHESRLFLFSSHMHSLFARAKREGVTMTRETW